jgi:hypothetical protein
MQVLVSSALFADFIKVQMDDYMGGFAGQVSGIIHDIKSARQVVEEMVEQTVDILTSKLPANVRIRY